MGVECSLVLLRFFYPTWEWKGDISICEVWLLLIYYNEEGFGNYIPEPFLFWIGVPKVYPPPKPR